MSQTRIDHAFTIQSNQIAIALSDGACLFLTLENAQGTRVSVSRAESMEDVPEYMLASTVSRPHQLCVAL